MTRRDLEREYGLTITKRPLAMRDVGRIQFKKIKKADLAKEIVVELRATVNGRHIGSMFRYSAPTMKAAFQAARRSQPKSNLVHVSDGAVEVGIDRFLEREIDVYLDSLMQEIIRAEGLVYTPEVSNG